jgi:hypothetical protein
MRRWLAIGMARGAAAAAMALASAAPASGQILASGHGPVFGLATPTNGQGAWSFDFGVMGRRGEADSGAMSRVMLGYGFTPDLQVTVSAPMVFSSAPLPPGRMTGMMPASGDFETMVGWRFHRQGLDVGMRFESTAYGSVIVPGPQRAAGLAGELRRAPGTFLGAATGMASRSHYLWGGVGYSRFAERDGDRRADILSYTAVWGYRPPALRRDYPHWDWRMMAELTGERSGPMRHDGAPMPGTGGHQVLVGPSVLGLYKNYGISGGVQLPIYRDVPPAQPRERFRYGVNFSYFF